MEAVVVQVMTYLVENENAALAVPARFLGRIHPHFREVVAVLAVQVADEARHVEVFTRRAELRGRPLGLSTVGGQASLLTLLEEPDFAVAHFLLSVLGEGTFLHLLSFLERHAPDPVTARVCHLALADEAATLPSAWPTWPPSSRLMPVSGLAWPLPSTSATMLWPRPPV